ncbi:3-dehydroquinate synthase [Bacillus lacus]|uniref:3-dehydroquinate synthase n=1 Tax=Metabacillus lacus TaxID=1983721 RepID=A0A7X2IWB3_9BACI|nr:3-dehydroquinate synthase [Metabacillus lacus]
MKTLHVQASSASYPVYIGEGLLNSAGNLLKELGLKPSKILIVTDKIVERLYSKELLPQLQKEYDVFTYIVDSNETAKSFENYHGILTYCLQHNFDRSSCMMALGGGVVGDLAGFAASTYMRGISFIQLPTTLLAHDSAVGGKVAINHPLGKNMIGSFYHPKAVIYDVLTLETLPPKERRSGFAEVIKHALIKDGEMLKWLHQNVSGPADIGPPLLEDMIFKGIHIKAGIVEKDEKETGIRAYLNFGHTLGHAIESEAGYGKVPHGDAVASGMLFATWLSNEILQSGLDYGKMYQWFKKLGFPVALEEHYHTDLLISRMTIDKKASGGNIRMVLLQDIGQPVLHDLTVDESRSFLQRWRKEGEL